MKKATPQDLELVEWAKQIMVDECDALGIEHVREWNIRLAYNPARYQYLRDDKGQYLRDKWGNVKRKQINHGERRGCSSGVYRGGWIGQISLKLGHDLQDARDTILHELAHHIDECTRGKVNRGEVDWHDERFWDIHFKLVEKYGLDLRQTYIRARNYKRRAATNAIAARTPQTDGGA